MILEKEVRVYTELKGTIHEVLQGIDVSFGIHQTVHGADVLVSQVKYNEMLFSEGLSQ